MKYIYKVLPCISKLASFSSHSSRPWQRCSHCMRYRSMLLESCSSRWRISSGRHCAAPLPIELLSDFLKNLKEKGQCVLRMVA